MLFASRRVFSQLHFERTEQNRAIFLEQICALNEYAMEVSSQTSKDLSKEGRCNNSHSKESFPVCFIQTECFHGENTALDLSTEGKYENKYNLASVKAFMNP